MTPALHLGDCLEVLRTMPDASVDAVVTDPPYGLAFMGKRWDYDVPTVEVWAECLRVLKPGGHLLAFAGTRTQHRMACRIEDAGFEIRDMIAWVYGSGFPKSLDVSKAIDRVNGDATAWQEFSCAYAKAVTASNLSHADIDRVLGIKSSSCYWARTDHRGSMPPRHHWEIVCGLLSLPPELARLYDEAEREVVGQKEMTDTSRARAGFSGRTHSPDYDGTKRLVSITAPATPAAQQWEGWGTALKPALEPITMARKPFPGTVAANVLEHGTGALNVDGCRNDTRWPANLIHDGSDEPSSLLGDAARFFYTSKATAAERQGVTHPTVKPLDLMAYLCRLVTPPGGTVLDPFMGSGTTIKAAIGEGFHAIGIERDEAYFQMAQHRLNGAQLGLALTA